MEFIAGGWTKSMKVRKNTKLKKRGRQVRKTWILVGRQGIKPERDAKLFKTKYSKLKPHPNIQRAVLKEIMKKNDIKYTVHGSSTPYTKCKDHHGCKVCWKVDLDRKQKVHQVKPSI